MQAIRSINTIVKAGSVVTVPKDEVWKIEWSSFRSDTGGCAGIKDFSGKQMLLGGGTSIRFDTSTSGAPVNIGLTGVAFKL